MMDVENISHTILRPFLSVLIVFLVVVILWTTLWKFALEPNPLIRDFFDLDAKRVEKKVTKELRRKD